MHTSIRNSIIHHFADDTNLLCSDKNGNKLKKKMNEDLRLISDWLCANKLSLNVIKKQNLLFSNLTIRHCRHNT